MNDASSLSDAELSALVAEKVAGWKRLPLNPAGMWGSKIHWQSPEGATSNYDSFPSYATSADAVLPLLNAAWYWVCDTGARSKTSESGMRFDIRVGYLTKKEGHATADTFARAACLALLAAHQP